MRAIILIMALLTLSSCASNNDMQQQALNTEAQMKISSIAFSDKGDLPSTYTCDGAGVNPPLTITGIPKEAKALALIVDDPDAPRGDWVHWVVWNIPITENIEEDSVPGVQGVNDFGDNNYGAPCPPSGTHRYFFKVYALDAELDLPRTTSKKTLESAMKGHILAKAEIIGNYKRK